MGRRSKRASAAAQARGLEKTHGQKDGILEGREKKEKRRNEGKKRKES